MEFDSPPDESDDTVLCRWCASRTPLAPFCQVCGSPLPKPKRSAAVNRVRRTEAVADETGASVAAFEVPAEVEVEGGGSDGGEGEVILVSCKWCCQVGPLQSLCGNCGSAMLGGGALRAPWRRSAPPVAAANPEEQLSAPPLGEAAALGLLERVDADGHETGYLGQFESETAPQGASGGREGDLAEVAAGDVTDEATVTRPSKRRFRFRKKEVERQPSGPRGDDERMEPPPLPRASDTPAELPTDPAKDELPEPDESAPLEPAVEVEPAVEAEPEPSVEGGPAPEPALVVEPQASPTETRHVTPDPLPPVIVGPSASPNESAGRHAPEKKRRFWEKKADGKERPAMAAPEVQPPFRTAPISRPNRAPSGSERLATVLASSQEAAEEKTVRCLSCGEPSRWGKCETCSDAFGELRELSASLGREWV